MYNVKYAIDKFVPGTVQNLKGTFSSHPVASWEIPKYTFFLEYLREHRRAPPLKEEPKSLRLSEVAGEKVPMSDWADSAETSH